MVFEGGQLVGVNEQPLQFRQIEQGAVEVFDFVSTEMEMAQTRRKTLLVHLGDVVAWEDQVLELQKVLKLA